MEHTTETQALLEQMANNSTKQVQRSTLQCILTGAVVLCCIGILVMLSALAGNIEAVSVKVETLAEQTEKLHRDVSDLSAQTELVLTNALDITQQLADADLQGLIEHADTLIANADTQLSKTDLPALVEQIETTLQETQSNMETAMGQLSAIDVAALNAAIADLAAVAEPLAGLAGIFGR